MLYIGLDTETWLITDESPIPQLVCMSISAEGEHDLYLEPDAGEVAAELLKNDQVTLVAHNAAFDFSVLAIQYPHLLELINNKYKKGQILCTRLYEKLLRLGQDGVVDAKEFSLAFCVEKYLGYDISENKGEGSWRMNYYRLDGVPIEEWTEEAKTYALEDAAYVLNVFLEQQKIVEFEDLIIQSYCDWLCCMMTKAGGLRIDHKFLEERLGHFQGIIDSQTKILVEQGFKVPKTKKNPEILKKDTKAIKKVIEEEYSKMEYDIPETDKGATKTDRATLEFIKGRHPGVDSLLALGTSEKAVSTYLLPWKEKDYLHPSLDMLKATGRMSCVAKWTKIDTPSGKKRIDEIKIGDEVFTHERRWRKVISTYILEKEQMYDVTLWNGDVLTCTKNHKLLLSKGEWITIGELNESFQKVLIRQEEYKRVPISVSEQECLEYAGNSGEDEDYSPKHSRVIKKSSIVRGIQGFEESKVFQGEDGKFESDEGEVGKETSQLEGADSGRSRIFNNSIQRKEGVRTQSSNGESTKIKNFAESSSSTPHRWESEEQRDRESSLVYKRWAQKHSLSSSEGLSSGSVKKISLNRCLEVYDIMVEEDHSYSCYGVFSHNCYRPNLQNVMRDGRIRGCIIPEDGYYLCSIDFSQLELCTLAQATHTLLGRHSYMLEAINDGRDLHCVTGANILGISYDDMFERCAGGEPEAKGARQLAKAANFGLPGGLGANTFIDYAKTGYGVTIDQTLAKRVIDAFFSSFPEVKQYFAYINTLKRETELGSFYMCEQLATDRVRMVPSKSYCSACNTFFQALAAEGVKLATIDVLNACWFDEVNANPLMIIHDEFLFELEKEDAHVYAQILSEIMIESMKKVLPDVTNIKAEPALMYRWEKSAEPVFDKEGQLIPWEYSDG